MKLQWILISATIFLTSCQAQRTTQSIDAEMATLLTEIQRAASDRSCKVTSDCAVLEFGTEACGTPTQHLVYSTLNTDVNLIISKSQRYTELQKIQVQGSTSCSIYLPFQVECKNLLCEPK
jgi:hypothetical protein